MIEIRSLFYRATKSPTSADSLQLLLFKTSTKNPLIIGYQGMSQMMLCLHTYNPYTKLSYFHKGKTLLENAINNDPKNIELRFLRLTVQLNTPSVLMYKTNIEEDKRTIFNGVSTIIDIDLLQRILNYTVAAKQISVDEKKIMQEAIFKNKNLTTQTTIKKA
ncbi:MAG: hypothetical protein H7141_09520 [Burkholderiales bacterium]|nr:hypothetical protein [Bacteroidia bacterium]